MTRTLTIRPSTPHDLAAVDALLARSYPKLLAPDYPPSVLVMALPLISRAQPALLASGTYYVAEDDGGEILGAGGWTRVAPGQGGLQAGVGHIRHVVTDHRAVRQGVGRAIMDRVFHDAAEAGCTVLDCLATRTAVPFYAAVGFRTLAPVSVSLGPAISFPAVRMVRML